VGARQEQRKDCKREKEKERAEGQGRERTRYRGPDEVEDGK